MFRYHVRPAGRGKEGRLGAAQTKVYQPGRRVCRERDMGSSQIPKHLLLISHMGQLTLLRLSENGSMLCAVITHDPWVLGQSLLMRLPCMKHCWSIVETNDGQHSWLWRISLPPFPPADFLGCFLLLCEARGCWADSQKTGVDLGCPLSASSCRWPLLDHSTTFASIFLFLKPSVFCRQTLTSSIIFYHHPFLKDVRFSFLLFYTYFFKIKFFYNFMLD